MDGENVTGCRLGISYTCTAGFYSDVVECSTLKIEGFPVRSSAGA